MNTVFEGYAMDLIDPQLPWKPVKNYIVNNKILNQEEYKGKGALLQFYQWGASDVYIHGNPQMSYFAGGQKLLLDERFYTNDVTKPYKVRSDDQPIVQYSSYSYSDNPSIPLEDMVPGFEKKYYDTPPTQITKKSDIYSFINFYIKNKLN